MTRREPEIQVVERPSKIKASEPTIEERIIEAARQFRSSRSGDIERIVAEMLEDGYHEALLSMIGVKKDTWSRGLAFDIYAPTPIARELKANADARARELVEKIDFSKVELTQAQVNAIESAYRSRLKETLADAARELAEEDARTVAAKVLGYELNTDGSLKNA